VQWLAFREISGTILFMNTFQIAKQLEQIALQVASLAKVVENLASEYPPVPDFAKKLSDEKRCLGCKDVIIGRTIRGLDEKHFKALERRIKKGEISEHDAIARGMLLPPDAGGRRPNVEYEKMFSELLLVAEPQPAEKAIPATKPKASRKPAKP
jgi:hypothetical protein